MISNSNTYYASYNGLMDEERDANLNANCDTAIPGNLVELIILQNLINYAYSVKRMSLRDYSPASL